MSIITFNKHTTDKLDFITNKDVYQIVPTHNKVDKYFVSTYPQLDNETNILIHTAFITRPFSKKGLIDNNEFHYNNMKYYMDLADKLCTKYILIHGPMNLEEYLNFEKGLNFIKDVYTDDYIICIEIPAFASSLIDYINKNYNKDYYNFICNYFDLIIKYNYQIVIDTAHLHTNGLIAEEMVELLKKYINHYDFIHMNGNKKPQFKYPDEHTHIDSINDKINNSYLLLKEIVKLNKICICENSNGEYEYWEDIANEFGFNLVKYNKYYDV